MHVFRFLHLLLFPILCSSSSNNQFEKVESCPNTYEQWTDRAQKKNCGQFKATPDFMCAAIENQPGNFGEICTVVGLSTAGKCAVLDADTYNLNFITCYASSGCPSKAYRASDIYKYQECFGNFYRVQSTTLDTATNTVHVTRNLTIDDSAKTSSEQNTVAIVIVTLIAYVFILSFLILFLARKRLFCRSNTEHSNHLERGLLLDPKTDADEDPTGTLKRITILTTYLRYRLVALCDITKLRNQILTHSESLKQHFDENITQLMYSDIHVIKNSSLNIVYMLLTNFCDIPTPRRGWGYRPDDNDTSLEADIERIRIFVNEFLDTRKCSAGELEKVVVRFKKDYGDIEIESKYDISHESKINYVEIKPDYIVDGGTVVTKAIKQIFENLEAKGIVICVGSIGCGKTTAMEYVSKKYKEEKWTVEWCENFIEKSDIDKLSTLRKTLLCCDNLFGRFGCQLFSKEVYKDFDNAVRTMRKRDKTDLKVLLGIHAHVLEEIKSIGCCNTLQNKNLIIDLDSLSKSEILFVYQLQPKNRIRNQETTSYEDILDILADRSDSVGTPFQTLMISTMPDVFYCKEFCNKPFEQLCKYFKNLCNRNKEAFLSLMYIMYVMIYNKDKDIVDSVAAATDAFLDKLTIEHHLKDLTPFTLEDEYTVELKHELIGIALFHVFLDVMNSPWSIFKACDIKMALELTRTDGEGPLHNFAVPLSRELFASAASIMKMKILDSKVDYKEHPLMEYFSHLDIKL